MKCLILNKSFKALGGIEYVIDFHLGILHSLGFTTTCLGISSTSYDKFGAPNYTNISNSRLSSVEGINSASFGIKSLAYMYKILPSYDFVIIHQPFTLGLLFLAFLPIYHCLAMITATPYPTFLVYLHALPSNNKVLLFVYRLILKMSLVLNSSVALAVSSCSHSMRTFYSSLPNPIYELPIPPPVYCITGDNQLLPYEEHLLEFLAQARSNGRNIALTIGRISYYKGLFTLIDAIKKIKTDDLFVIAGSGPLAPKLCKYIDALPSQTSRKIIFYNKYISDLLKLKLFEVSSYYILPSITQSEAYGIAQLEAMMFGLPVLNFQLHTGVNVITRPNFVSHTANCPISSDNLSLAIDTISHKVKLKYYNSEKISSYAQSNYGYAICSDLFISAIRELAINETK